MGGDYIVAARPHYSCPLTSQLMYMHSTITPESPQSRRLDVLKYLSASYQLYQVITQPELNETERCKVLRIAGNLQNPLEGRFYNNKQIVDTESHYAVYPYNTFQCVHISHFISFRISFVITTLCDLDGQLSPQRGFTSTVCCPC